MGKSKGQSSKRKKPASPDKQVSHWVQYSSVEKPDEDIGAAAPAFPSQSRTGAELLAELRNQPGMPTEGPVFYWMVQANLPGRGLWIALHDSVDLSSLAEPIRIKMVRMALQGGTAQAGLTRDPELTAFWSALARATEVDIDGVRYLKLEGCDYPLEGASVQDKLLSRKSYVDLSKLARNYFDQKDSRNGKQLAGLIYILRGNPGIGKSLFLFYFMQKLAAQGQNVVWQRKNRRAVVFTKEGAFEGPEDKTLTGCYQYLKDPDSWYLVDAVEPDRVHAKTLLVTSPDHNVTKEPLKWPNHRQAWMPLWRTKSELVPAGKTIFGQNEEDIRDRRARWGPIPRHVLQNKDAANVTESEKAIRQCTLAQLTACMVNSETAPKDMSHRLVCVKVYSDYSEGPVTFASKYIMDELAARFDRDMDVSVQAFLASSNGNDAIQSFRGKILERRKAHELLQKGGEFKCRSLSNNTECEVQLPACEQSCELSNHSEISGLAEGVYGKGKYENMGGVDAVVKPKKLYQITVSQRHRIHTRSIVTVAEKMGGFEGLELYWCVDEQGFTPEFSKQTFVKTQDVSASKASQAKKIKQYLLQLPTNIRLTSVAADSDIEDDEELTEEMDQS